MDSTGPSGRQVSLPSAINLSTFTAARMKEIKAMRKALSENAGTKMAFQKLPKHMRRRAMSHVVKRLPRRLREIHFNQMKKSGLPPKTSKLSRKHRRRPLNLKCEYSRRQRRVKWLDTHIWHAKRFHMVEKWGFKLPKQPCDKSFRACYRATTQHCLVQDLSYIRCIEIAGAYPSIISKLAKVTDSKIGLTFSATCFCEGKKFGTLTIFDPDCTNSMRKAIGEVDFFWDQPKSEKRTLWVFVHPAYYARILELFVGLFEIDLSLEENVNKSGGVIVKELQYDLGKFRLTGPLSTAILKHALRTPILNENCKNLPPWINSESMDIFNEQNQAFADLTNVNCLPPNMVLAVVVQDPRMVWPQKRTKATLDDIQTLEDIDIETFQKNLSFSPLLVDSFRNFVQYFKMSNAQIVEMRKSSLVPGLELPGEQQSVIPIILLWRVGNRTSNNNGYGSGWDVIVPSVWSQAFFMSFVMWGGRVGGLRETESIAFEKSQCDLLYPDTTAGEQEEHVLTDTYRDTFFRLPPNKRTNFNKFAIASPFSFNWKLLISDWSGQHCSTFFVLRDRLVLKEIQDGPAEVLGKGHKTAKKTKSEQLYSEGTSRDEIVEPMHKDLLAQKRKALRQEHKSLLQKLRRRRKRCRKLKKPSSPTDIDILTTYRHKMRSLWLPEPKTIRYSCIRPVIGFIKHGAFSFTFGQSKGLGYIAGSALTSLTAKNKVLIRNPNSQKYKAAVLDIVVE
ncbi:hypothetical protein HUJ04_011032 [Dendroctonus ponderosae]|nr:hypothetical protein HUJ04_011032 [Dendroctonus ponderosae]